MSVKPLASIVIPSYNAAPYLGESVRSALAQTYAPIEVIVVDDGSTDGTKDIVKEFERDARFRYMYQANKGLAGARNTGIKAAQGKYIALLDADDIFLPGKIEEQVGVLEKKPDYGVCYCDLLHFTELQTAPGRTPAGSGKRTFYHHRYRYPSGDIFAALLHTQFINPLSVLARRDVFEKFGYFDENLRRSEDWDLWLRWAHAGVKFYYFDKPLAHYRMRSIGNLSSLASEPEMKEKNLELFSRVGRALSPAEFERYDFRNILRKLRLKTVFAHLMVGDKKSALKFADQAAVRLMIVLVPAAAWGFVLGTLRALKHRSLLKRL